MIASPCALVIATPITMVSGLTAAASRGIIIKGRLQLEQVNNLRMIAFDKTGTLTTGTLQLEEFEAQSEHFSQDELLLMTSTLASRFPSSHLSLNHNNVEKVE